MIVEYYKKNKLIKLFIIFSFCICWLSISTSFNDLFIFSNNKEINIKLVVNFLRQAFIYFCFFFYFFLILFFKKKIFKKEKLIYLFFGIYFLAQIPGLIFSENKFENIYLIISSLTAILTIILIEEFSQKTKKIFIYICFCILSIVLLLNFIPQVKLYIEGQQIFMEV